MKGSKIKKLAKTIINRNKTDSWYELCFINNEAVFFTDGCTLICNKYDENNIDVNPVTKNNIAKTWRNVLKERLDSKPIANIRIPELFYIKARIFKSPQLYLSNKSKIGAVYIVNFCRNSISVENLKEEEIEFDMWMIYSKGYKIDKNLEHPIIFNLFYLIQYKPKDIEILESASGFTMRVLTSYDKEIKDFDTCLIQSTRIYN